MTKLLEAIPLFYYDVVAIGIYVAILFMIKKRNVQNKTKVLYLLSGISFVALLINNYCFYLDGWHWLTLLPFHLCYIGVIIIPLALLIKNTTLMDFAFYLCVPGAFAALILPSKDYIAEPFSLLTLSFFVFHFLNVAIPLLASRWGLYDPSPSFKKAIRVSLTGLVIAGMMHLLNLFLMSVTNLEINYFYTFIKYAAPTNPAFELLGSFIPYNYFYLWPGLLVLYGYMGFVFVMRSVSSYWKQTANITG
ncbi:Integral membrane protein [Bacillus sp. THAF10]|uniref:TMEM164 family acyltransferase n=1 Tax=Bacillus sp. THAF10 TaxID=2587848 RepID=UPI001267DFD4|nr:YwaF family protein [Bacillus sp. THAF10]QFT91125.1 Integral membrane protein [Bacillus sp. THAF10]